MARWFTSLFFLIVLVGSVPAGTPFADGMKENMCAMKCCKKSAKSENPQKDNSKFLCRVLVCSQNLPANTTLNTQMNFAPMLVVSEKATLFEILFSTSPKEDAKIIRANDFRLKTSQPKYIQNKSLLI